MLSNILDDKKGVLDAAGDARLVQYNCPAGISVSFILAELTGGSQYSSNWVNTTGEDTRHYCDFYGNSAVGTYGTIYLDVYDDEAKTNLLQSLSLVLHSRVSFRYNMPVNTNNTGTAGRSITGVIRNLDLNLPLVIVQKLVGIFGLGKLGLR